MLCHQPRRGQERKKPLGAMFDFLLNLRCSHFTRFVDVLTCLFVLFIFFLKSSCYLLYIAAHLVAFDDIDEESEEEHGDDNGDGGYDYWHDGGGGGGWWVVMVMVLSVTVTVTLMLMVIVIEEEKDDDDDDDDDDVFLRSWGFEELMTLAILLDFLMMFKQF